MLYDYRHKNSDALSLCSAILFEIEVDGDDFHGIIDEAEVGKSSPSSNKNMPAQVKRTSQAHKTTLD
jgi:hypothetical protein